MSGIAQPRRQLEVKLLSWKSVSQIRTLKSPSQLRSSQTVNGRDNEPEVLF